MDIDVETRIEQPLRTALVEMLATPDSGVVVADRIVAAEVLGDLGDPRLLDPTTGNSSIGDYWYLVERGTFWFGDDNKGDLRQMELPYDFQIGRYLVTNAEYARFMKDGGYDPSQPWWDWSKHARAYLAPDGPRWWNEAPFKGKQITAPRVWDNPRCNNPLQPVLFISWYEAHAYCIWLTRQGHAKGWLPEQEIIRLPTSLEWERAARHLPWAAFPGAQQFVERRIWRGMWMSGWRRPSGKMNRWNHSLILPYLVAY